MCRGRICNQARLAIVAAAVSLLAAPQGARSDDGAGARVGDCPIPLPSVLALKEFESRLYKFLDDHLYDQQPGHLHWARDKKVRDTGDYRDKVSYGTHPAVKVYYSPTVIAWLKGGRQGALPDGAVMVKEQYPPPAVRYDGLGDEELRERLTSWTVMIKDSRGSKDGWFWADYAPQRDQAPVQSQQIPHTSEFPFIYPSTGFGQYCIRCHASAEREFTFAALKNVEGFPGDPLTFRVDDSWKTPGGPSQLAREQERGHGLGRRAERSELRLMRPPIDSNAEFLRCFTQIARVHYNDVVPIVNESYDRVVCRPDGRARFVTSDQCMSCHGGLSGAFQSLFLPKPSPQPDDGEIRGLNISAHGEWRWSLMGLSGRDPVFYAQLESEVALHGHTESQAAAIADTCFRCHGVMGQRQFHSDREGQFRTEFVELTDRSDPNFNYGALARDGVSCTVCHRMVDAKAPLEELITGKFQTSSREEIYGPYADKDILPYAMKNGLGLEPKYSEFLKSSRLCASCHILRVPIYDKRGQEVAQGFEQSTYLEWLNSQYENEVNVANPNAKTCQQCHMPGEYHEPGSIDGKRVKVPPTRITAIEDDGYPAAENRAPSELIRTKIVNEYARHELLGINAFVLEMFNQFDNVLGVRKTNYMTGAVDGLPNAIENALYQARTATASVEILSSEIRDNKIVTQVKVTNLTGHRFPSGVGFRRAFLEFQLVDTSDGRERMAWASGRTNSLGILVDDQGEILPSEFFDADDRGLRHQPHYRKISAQDRVQIYQELNTNTDGEFTTSFLERRTTVKDNRLLPKGWTAAGPPGLDLPPEFIRATHPVNVDDADFSGSDGSDIITYEVPMGRWDQRQLKVVAKLFYQSLPPFYLKMRFETGHGDATKRLHYLCSHLSLQGTELRNWKLLIDGDVAQVSLPKQ
jgi:Cytochrome P460